MSETQSHTAAKSGNALGFLVIVFVLLHGGLSLYDLNHPDAFVSGDRSGSRFNKINYVLDYGDDPAAFRPIALPPGPGPDTVFERILEVGSPGDFLVHAAAFAIGGRSGVILMQMALALVALICAYRLAVLMKLPSPAPFWVGLIYLSLPGSLMNPHQLGTEAIFNPLVTIALYLLVSGMEAGYRRGAFVMALLLLGVAAWVRMQLLIFPVFLAAVIWFHYWPASTLRALAALTVPMVVFAVWTAVVTVETASSDTGSYDNSLNLEFYKISTRMSQVDDLGFDKSAYPDERMPLGDFLAFVVAHPTTLVKWKAGEVANLVVNPGYKMFAGSYLAVFDVPDDTSYWRELRYKVGVWGVIKTVLAQAPDFVAVMVVGGIVWMALLVLVVIGIPAFARHRPVSVSTRVLLLGYVAYTAAIVQASSGVRWGHRTSFDMITALLVVMGALAVRRWWRSRRSVSSRSVRT